MMHIRWYRLKNLLISECGRIVKLKSAFKKYAAYVRSIPYEIRCTVKINAKLKKTQKCVKRKIFDTILLYSQQFRRTKHFCRLLGVHVDSYNKRKWLHKWHS